MEYLETVQIRLSPTQIKLLDKIVDKDYGSRSEAVRDAVCDMIEKELGIKIKRFVNG